jgi:hypothetical protein
VKSNPELEVNNNLLNSLVLLHANALRVEDLDAYVLPLFDKFKVKYDVFTFQHLSKLYLNLRDFDMVKKLYRNMQQ